MSVPFRTVAIYDPERCPGPSPELVTGWALQSLERGADAFLLRNSGDNNTLPEVFPTIRQITDRHCVILLAQNFRGLDCTSVDGIHLKSNEPVPENRPRSLLLGRSCHTSDDVRRAKKEGMDYVFLSPVFPTLTHPDQAAIGLFMFGTICQGNRIPVFGLGGITMKSKARVLDSGAAGIASISMFL